MYFRYYSLFLLSVTFSVHSLSAQPLSDKLAVSVASFLQDSQLKHAHLGFYVQNTATGEVVFDHDGDLGLSPASTQKIFTSAASYTLLGTDFRFKTIVGYTGKIEQGILKGNLVIRGIGDPTFGSWRYDGYKPEDVKQKILNILRKKGIQSIDGNVIADETLFPMQNVPGGWPWNDMGQYYGAANWGLNWRENQLEYHLKAGSHKGAATQITGVFPLDSNISVFNFVKTGTADEGDNSYIYNAPYSKMSIIDGSIPSGKTTSPNGSMVNPPQYFVNELKSWLSLANIHCKGVYTTGGNLVLDKKPFDSKVTAMDTLYSPTMDAMMSQFLHKSINLYGESFMKVMGWQKDRDASIDHSVESLKSFWVNEGLDQGSIHIIDGSGLSPQNYVTPQAEVFVLKYALRQPWYKSFYDALPTYNGMRMKSGTIGVCKAFAGYQKSTDGNLYAFSMIINNYSGSTSHLVEKMYHVLNTLK